MKKLIALLLVLGAGAANAAPVTWNINVLLNDQGTVTGSFVYDAALNEYSAIDILTTAGATLPGNHYLLLSDAFTPINARFALFHPSDVADKTGLPVLGIFLYYDAMTDAGGGIGAIEVIETFCVDATCSDTSGGPRRQLLSGAINGIPMNAVPIPAAVWLFGSGLGLLAWFRRRPIA